MSADTVLPEATAAPDVAFPPDQPSDVPVTTEERAEGADAGDGPSEVPPPGELSASPAGDAEERSPSSHTLEALDADLVLHSMGVLTGLIREASDALNQCLLAIEDKLHALPVAQERWIQIQEPRSNADADPQKQEGQTLQVRMFGGVPVAILKIGSSETQPHEPRRERQDEVGYALAGTAWSLMTRTTLPSAEDAKGNCQFTNLKLLRDVPLELRLEASRQIPALLKMLDTRSPAAAGETPAGRDGEMSPVVCNDQTQVDRDPLGLEAEPDVQQWAS